MLIDAEEFAYQGEDVMVECTVSATNDNALGQITDARPGGGRRPTMQWSRRGPRGLFFRTRTNAKRHTTTSHPAGLDGPRGTLQALAEKNCAGEHQ
jgi:hypothetical protein